MTKLEDRILKKVYVFETKRTLIESIVKIIFYVFLAGFVIFAGQAIYEILMEEGAFDVFQIVGEDIEIIRMFAGDALYTFYQELPKELSLLFLIGVIILSVSMVIVIKHFGAIKNKMKALIRFWKTL